MGPPQARPDLPDYIRHARETRWLRTDVPRAAFGADFSNGLGYRGTVHEFGHSGAVQTVRSLVGDSSENHGKTAMKKVPAAKPDFRS